MNAEPLHLLIVEDEEAHVEAIRRAFEAAGGHAEIHAVGTLREYREHIAAHPPDVALVDLNLPDGRAVEVLTHPADAAPFPILVMTAFGNQQIVVEVMKAGALDYVVKSPEAFAMLPRTVEGALREWKLLQSHKQAQAALCESEEKLRSLFEHMAAGCCLDEIVYEAGKPVDYRILDVNPGWERIVGISRSQAVGSLASKLYGTGKPPFFEIYAKVAETGEAASFESYFPPIGKHLHITASCPARGRFSTVVSDITEHKRAEETLRESEARLASIYDTVGDVIFQLAVEEEGRYRFASVNPAFLAVTGLTSAQVVGQWVDEVIPEPSLSMVLEKYAAAIREKGIVRWEETSEYPSGRLTGEVSIAPVFDDAGHCSHLVGSVHDITARKRAEALVLKEHQRFNEILEKLPLMICLLTPDYHVPFANRRFRELFGEADGRRCFEYVFHRTEPCPECQSFTPLKTQAPHHWERTTPNGTCLDMYDFPFTDVDGSPLILEMDIDITERKQAEEALRGLSLQLSKAQDEERRRIARDLHDSIGQKLAALSMSVGLLQDATNAPGGKVDNMFADCVALIEQCAQEIRTLSHLLHPPLLDELGLAAAIRNCVEGFSKRSGIHVTFDALPAPERLAGEVEIALFRVVQEGLTNIYRHAGAPSARIRLACDAEQVTIEVRDQGRGMSAETLRAIQAGTGSLGVGIAGMRERMRLLGGRLEVESGGQGTTVRAIVPRGQEPTEQPLTIAH